MDELFFSQYIMRSGPIAIILSITVICSLIGFFRDAKADSATVPPAGIMDLTAGTISSNSAQLTWSAPGADGFSEPASSYDLRMSTSKFNSLNWDSQIKITAGLPTPGQPGAIESFALTSLQPNTTYFVAIRGVDSFGVFSIGFNVVQITTLTDVIVSVSSVNFTPHLDGVITPALVNFTISFFNVGTATKVAEFTSATDSSGNIALPGSVSLNPGMYDIFISSPNYLRKKLSNYSMASGATVNLPVLTAGDFDGNNLINSLDSSFMTTHWFTNNTVADVNKDGLVNSIDLSFVVKNWLKAGD